MQINSVVFALSRLINKQKVCENIPFAQIKTFCKIGSRLFLTPNLPPHCVRPWESYPRKFVLCLQRHRR